MHCDHSNLIDDHGCVVCIDCGLVLPDDAVPWTQSTSVRADPVEISKTTKRRIDLIAFALRLPDRVAEHAAVLATSHTFRSSNHAALVACVHVAAKHARLDRLEREVLGVTRADSRKFGRYVKKLRETDSKRDDSGLDTLIRMVPRLATDYGLDAKRLDHAMRTTYRSYHDTVSLDSIVKIALRQSRSDPARSREIS